MANPNPRTEQIENQRFDRIDPAEAKRRRIKGAKASNKVQKKKKDAVQVLKALIESGECKIKRKGPGGKVVEEAITYETLPIGILQNARKGNSRAWEMIMSYLVGKPKETKDIDITSNGETLNFGFDKLLKDDEDKDS